MQAWKTLQKQPILTFGRWLTVENRTIELPGGKVIDNWAWVITPDYVNIIAFTPDDRMLCFRQVKYAIDGETLAPMGGYIEPGEDPLAAAQRELLEETGYVANQWTALGVYPVDANRGAGTAYFFLARDAVHFTDRDADDLEEQELLLLTMEEVKAELRSGHFKCLPWAASVALALIHLDG